MWMLRSVKLNSAVELGRAMLIFFKLEVAWEHRGLAMQPTVVENVLNWVTSVKLSILQSRSTLLQVKVQNSKCN